MKRTAALGPLFGLLVLPLLMASQTWAQDEEAVEIRGPSVVEVGERVAAVADNWPANSVVTFEICGQLAINGSADCDMATSRSAGVGSDGRTGAQLEVVEPPEPCPCVVRATSTSSTRVATTSLDIQGVPFEPVQVDPARLNPPQLEIRTAHLRSTSGWRSLFGGPPEATAVLTLANSGRGPIEHVPVTVLYGRGDAPTRMGGEPAVDRLGPGEERRAEVPFQMDPLSFGTYTVRIEVGDAARQVVVVREFTTYPWGLPLLILVGLGLLTYAWVRRRRNRAGGVGTDPMPVPPPTDNGGRGSGTEGERTSTAGCQRAWAARSESGMPEP